jgi:integrase
MTAQADGRGVSISQAHIRRPPSSHEPIKAKRQINAGLVGRNLHFHDLRGTAATKFYIAGLPERVVAEIMAWKEEHVARIIRRYVDRSAATRAIIQHLNERRT